MKSQMYFSNFPKIQYVSQKYSQLLTDITTGVRFKDKIVNDVPIFDEYAIKDNETFEYISEKLYGTAQYHWILMLLNNRYDHFNDLPLSQYNLSKHVVSVYGENNIYGVHSYSRNGVPTIGEWYLSVPSTYEKEFEIGDYISTESVTKGLIQNIFTLYTIPEDAGITQYSYENKTVKLYPTIRSRITNDNSIGTATLFRCSPTEISIGDFVLDFNKIQSDVKSITLSIGNGADLRFDTIKKEGWIELLVKTNSGEFNDGDTCLLWKYNNGYVNTLDFTLGNYKTHLNKYCTPITNYEYENTINEAKRIIRIIPPATVGLVIRKFETLMNSK